MVHRPTSVAGSHLIASALTYCICERETKWVEEQLREAKGCTLLRNEITFNKAFEIVLFFMWLFSWLATTGKSLYGERCSPLPNVSFSVPVTSLISFPKHFRKKTDDLLFAAVYILNKCNCHLLPLTLVSPEYFKGTTSPHHKTSHVPKKKKKKKAPKLFHKLDCFCVALSLWSFSI